MHGPSDPVPSSTELAVLLDAVVASGPSRPALAWGDTVISYRELRDAADRVRSRLTVSPGERVAVIAPNAPALVIGMFAAWRSGAVTVPLSARLGPFELERAFADARPAAAVCVMPGSGARPSSEIMAGSGAGVRQVLVVDPLGFPGESGSPASGSPERSDSGELSPPGLAAIMYTSGTTGEAKGARLSHSLLAGVGRNTAELLAGYGDATHALVAPASHAFGLGCLLGAITAGALTVMVDATTSMGPLVTAVRAHDAWLVHGSPALFHRVLRAGSELPVRGGLVAGATCPPGLLEALDQRGLRVLNVYGMSEFGAATACRADDPPEIRYGTAGRALSGYQLREHDGEIQVHCDHLIPGYHGRPLAESELTPDGWVRTGDLGTLDPSGNLTIAGRAKEVVHVGGYNVFPAEIESFLLTHPAIEAAVIIGAAHAVLGETVEAFVVGAADANLEPRDVVRFARAGVAGYKVPYAVHVVDELPMLASGKPDRRALARRREPAEAQ